MKRLSLFLAVMAVLCLCACNHAEDAQYRADLKKIISELAFLNNNCDYVTNAVYALWENLSADEAALHFQIALLFDDGEKTPEEYADILPFSKNEIDVLLWGIARGLNPAVLDTDILYDGSKVKNGKFAGNGEQETIVLCAELCTAYKNILDMADAVSREIRIFKKQYQSTHAEEVDLLNSWYMESALYADFALSPSGSMIPCKNFVIEEYRDMMGRYRKELETRSDRRQE